MPSSSHPQPDPLFSVDGKVALVTGGTAGIGAMIARGLAERGATTYIVGRDADRCRRAAEEISHYGPCRPLPADLSELDGIERLTSELARREKRLDILVNNAGAVRVEPIDQFSEGAWDDVFKINVRSPFFLVQKSLPLLRAAVERAGDASVINIGSVAGLADARPALGSDAFSYSPSKAAAHQLTRRLARRLGSENIRVNGIAPGVFPTELSKSSVLKNVDQVLAEIPRRRFGEAEDIVGVTVYLASKASAFVTGAILPVDGAMSI